MNITGLDCLTFSVTDLEGAIRFAADYGLEISERSSTGAKASAVDGTHLRILCDGDLSLPPAVAASPNIREITYGVGDPGTLDLIAAELSKDRHVSTRDGVVRSIDEDGYPIAFAMSVRRTPLSPHYGINVPGQPPGRLPNSLGLHQDGDDRPRTLSHVVLFVRDKYRTEAFYRDRLGFRTVDEFTNLGPFMRPAGTLDHHTNFFVQAPMLGIQHFTFHFSGINEVLQRGWDFQRKGYRSEWGPGRHILGSNFFWYFKSPFGCDMELDADMDLHDDSWVPRRVPVSADRSQSYLMQYRDKWFPGG